MQRSVLAKKRTAIHRHHCVIGERYLDSMACQYVFLRTRICRHKDSVVQHQIIGICGRKARTVFRIIYRVRKRQFHQIESVSICCTKHLKLRTHLEQFFKMRIVHIPASGEYYGVIRSHTGQCIDMRVCVVPFKRTVIEPKHMVCPKTCLKHSGSLLLGFPAVAVW